jgi:hypothetical protein
VEPAVVPIFCGFPAVFPYSPRSYTYHTGFSPSPSRQPVPYTRPNTRQGGWNDTAGIVMVQGSQKSAQFGSGLLQTGMLSTSLVLTDFMHENSLCRAASICAISDLSRRGFSLGMNWSSLVSGMVRRRRPRCNLNTRTHACSRPSGFRH